MKSSPVPASATASRAKIGLPFILAGAGVAALCLAVLCFLSLLAIVNPKPPVATLTVNGLKTAIAETIAAAPRRLPNATPGPAGHPPGTTGQCNDGTYTTEVNSHGACSHHGGLAHWWGP